MKSIELAPEEKLLNAIFGERAGREESRHFLNDEGCKAVNDLLDEFVSKSPTSRARGIKVIRLRFGLDARTEEEKAYPYSSHPRTLEEVGAYFGIGREGIRQVEAKTLRMLRHPHYSSRLKRYLEGR